MPTQVLVVDDSAFFRRRIKEIIEKNPNLSVVGFAENGREAIEKTRQLKPDVITMDYEMPLMDGISAVRQIMADMPTPILMFSSLSYEGARVTLDALEAGALDYLPKSFESMSGDAQESTKLLQDRVLAIARRRSYMRSSPATEKASTPVTTPVTPRKPEPVAGAGAVRGRANGQSSGQTLQASGRRLRQPLESLEGERLKMLLIGASTGGPVALQNILMALPANYPLPILLVQHMPGTFTSAFAERLNRMCRIQVKEACDNDSIRPGQALLAPGGMQMLVSDNGHSVRIVESKDQIQYKPSVDITFGSAARNVRGKMLAVVLTGMGSDGREGCKMLKRGKATVWTQSEQSCVVYGMPMAVESAGLSDAVIDIKDMATLISELR